MNEHFENLLAEASLPEKEKRRIRDEYYKAEWETQKEIEASLANYSDDY